MINEFRTLLLNKTFTDRPPVGTYLEEYVPTYNLIVLPDSLIKFRKALLGLCGDTFYENYRLCQIMRLLHANSYFDTFIKSLDSRISYDLKSETVRDAVSISNLNNSDITVSVVGKTTANTILGRAKYEWLVKISNGVAEITDTLTNETQVSSVISGNQLTLVGLGCNLNIVILGSNPLTNIFLNVLSISTPTDNICEHLYNCVYVLSEGDKLEIINKSSSFYNMWKSSPILSEQLGSFLCMYIEKVKSYAR